MARGTSAERKLAQKCIDKGGMWDFFGTQGCVPRTAANAPTITKGVPMATRTSLALARTTSGLVGPTSPTFQRGYSTPVFRNGLTPGTTPAPVQPNFAGGGDPYSTLANAGCNLITNAALRAACIAASGLLLPGGGGGGGSPMVPITPSNGALSCPAGMKWDGTQCVTTGIGRFLPGDIGDPDYAWQAMNGRYGAGVMPYEETRSVARCPTGYVLGKDGVCYDHLRKGDRMWNPGTKPMFTGGDMAALRRAKRLKARLKSVTKLFPQPKAVRGFKRKKR